MGSAGAENRNFLFCYLVWSLLGMNGTNFRKSSKGDVLGTQGMGRKRVMIGSTSYGISLFSVPRPCFPPVPLATLTIVLLPLLILSNWRQNLLLMLC